MLDRRSEMYQKHLQELDVRYARQAHQLAVIVGVGDLTMQEAVDMMALENKTISKYALMELLFGFVAIFLQDKKVVSE